MLAGEFEQAWQVSDDLVRRGLHHPVWKGQSFAGQRVLIRCVHGLGDAIQFIRYAKLLKEAGAVSVSAQMHPELVGLLSTAPGLDWAFGWDDTADYDVDIEIMELPWAFRSTVESLPCDTPYLRPLTGRAPIRDTPCKGRIGLVWNSSEWDNSRSIPLKQFERLKRWQPISLQHGPQHRQAIAETWVDYSGEQSSDIVETATDIDNLALLITVDTMAAHLAGALGVPVFLLLKYDADWRWMRGRSDSPWYPSTRLFRQSEAGNWDMVIGELDRAIENFYG